MKKKSIAIGLLAISVCALSTMALTGYKNFHIPMSVYMNTIML